MKKSLIIFCFILLGCEQSKIVLADFDSEQWKQAPICSDERVQLALILEKNEPLLIGKRQSQIVRFLGVAAKHELSLRNEKIFYYTLNKDCENQADQYLQIFFDALGRTKEVVIIQN